MYDCLIFDWSGTLGDDFQVVIDATNYVFKKSGREEIQEEEFRKNFCLPYFNFYRRYIPQISQNQIDIWFREGFHQSYGKIALFSGTREVLSFCKKNNILLLMLSSVSSDLLIPQLKELKVENYFEKVFADSIDKTKQIQSILNKYQLQNQKVAFVGDMVHDVETAKIGRIDSIALTQGYTLKEDLQKSNPDFLFSNLGDLIHFLLQNKGNEDKQAIR